MRLAAPKFHGTFSQAHSLFRFRPRVSLPFWESNAMTVATDINEPEVSGRIERRAFPRRRSWDNASFVPADKPLTPAVNIKPLNISQGGLGFISPKELTVGQRI